MKCKGQKNLADILTKHVGKNKMDENRENVGFIRGKGGTSRARSWEQNRFNGINPGLWGFPSPAGSNHDAGAPF